MRAARPASALWLLLAVSGCFGRADRWYLDDAPDCEIGARRCTENLEVCADTGRGPIWLEEEGCAERGLVCAPSLLDCSACEPGSRRCQGADAEVCNPRGTAFEHAATCNIEAGDACRLGACVNLCTRAAEQRSNVGCEYWAVDLDNARIDDTLNAAAQQFAVVLSNNEPDLPTDIVIEQDDAEPGQPAELSEVLRARVAPFSFRIVRLGPREVDGSRPGTFNTGTHTALSRAAYRIRSTVPIVAYQFNPLDNVGVFSNDASLLKPVEALTPVSAGLNDAYVVLGWPQTIAATDNPKTNFSSRNPTNLRAFLTLVGTRGKTRVRVTPTTHVVPGGPVAATAPGGTIEAELEPFDVLNLETGDFNADFTGTLIEADGPVVAFSGSEASDAPFFPELSRRRCCADHLEEQLDPIRTAGKSFIATVSPNRTEALVAAGARIGTAVQTEYFRLIAVTHDGARVTTTLPDEAARFELPTQGSFIDLSSAVPFAIDSDAPVMLESVSGSQAAANVPGGLPGGDPSMLVIPPIEQFRASYVFLTPDKYSFDFIRVIAPPDASIVFNGQALEDVEGCSSAALPVSAESLGTRAADLVEGWAVHTCQLSHPIIDSDLPPPANLKPGLQGDGPQFLIADRPVGVLVDGFDSFVSYAYAGGTDLNVIVPE